MNADAIDDLRLRGHAYTRMWRRVSFLGVSHDLPVWEDGGWDCVLGGCTLVSSRVSRPETKRTGRTGRICPVIFVIFRVWGPEGLGSAS
jgi:hypothetical protein